MDSPKDESVSPELVEEAVPVTPSSSTTRPSPQNPLPVVVAAPAIPAAAPDSAATSVMTPWSNWEAKEAFAKKLLASGFLPSNIRYPAQVLAIIMTGQEMGIPPMRALRHINVISGKPTLSAELMMAKMLQGGVKCTWLKTGDDGKEAVLKAQRPTVTFTGRYTWEEAKAAGLTGKEGWKKYPGAMLRARVIALVARVVAPDLIGGLYTPEEMGADVNATGEVVQVVTGAPSVALPGEQPIVDVSGLAEAPERTVAQWVLAFQAAPDAAAVNALRAEAKETPMSATDALAVTAAWLDAKQRTAGTSAPDPV